MSLATNECITVVHDFRAPELMFQPSMMGNLEAGLAETMDYVFKHFSPEDQLLLANNVFLTGGCSQFPGETLFTIICCCHVVFLSHAYSYLRSELLLENYTILHQKFFFSRPQ